MDMAYNVLGVCRLIVNYSNEKNYNISNLKLQKLLYFIQAYFLVKRNKPCFNEEIQAWAFGPVVPEAYQEFKQYGGCNIPEIRDGRIGKEIKECKFEKSDQDDIERIVDVFSGYSASALVTLSHNQDPWKNNYEPGANKEIDPKDIKEYFNGR